MTTAQSLITIGIIALGTVFTRFLPFWLFPKGKPGIHLDKDTTPFPR